ncbi:hypothetical protein M514_10072, partial [Trichuris suis]
MLDTGSPVSILPADIFRRYFPSVQLCKSTVSLVTYTKSALPTLGCFAAIVGYKGRTASTNFFVVPSGTPLLGTDLVGALKIAIRGMRVVSTLSTTFGPCRAISSIKNFVHEVKVRSDVKPVQQKMRRPSLSVRNAVSAELQRLLDEEIIERVNASEWISPIVVIQKKSGGIRLCVDLREPNKAVIADCFPLPHIDDLLLKFQGSSVFSILDLKAAYRQLILHENSRDLTAFITHDGLYRFRRVPYGLSSAPSAFQKIMAEILHGLPGVVCYLDDIVVFGKSTEEHDRNLNTVFRRLQQYNVVLNESKCKLRQKELLFLGYKISAEGIRPDVSRITAFLEITSLKDTQQLRSFIGLLS